MTSPPPLALQLSMAVLIAAPQCGLQESGTVPQPTLLALLQKASHMAAEHCASRSWCCCWPQQTEQLVEPRAEGAQSRCSASPQLSADASSSTCPAPKAAQPLLSGHGTLSTWIRASAEPAPAVTHACKDAASVLLLPDGTAYFGLSSATFIR